MLNQIYPKGVQRMNNATFSAHRYGPEFSGFAGRDMDPARYANLNRVLGVR